MRWIIVIFLFAFIDCFGQQVYSLDRNTDGGQLYRLSGDRYYQAYNSDALALFARAPIQPASIEKRIYSDLFDSLQVTIGTGSHLWDTLSCLWVPCVFDSSMAKLNLRADSCDLTTVNHPTFVPYYGYYGNGTSSYLNTNFNPTTNDTHYKQDHGCFGISLDSLSSATGAYWGVSIGSWHSFIIPNLGGAAYGRLNASGNVTNSNTCINEIFIVNRINSANHELYIGEDKYSAARTAVLPADGEFYLLARNSDGSPTNYSNNNLNYSFIGGGYTEDQILRLERLLNDFKTSMRIYGGLIAGFLPDNSSELNTYYLQKALADGGTYNVTIPGEYKLDSTIWLCDSTTVNFSDGVILSKYADYPNVLCNIGALTKEFNYNIELNGLNLKTNGYSTLVDLPVYGLRGQISFFFVKNLIIKNFECRDGEASQFMIEIAQWENILLDGIIIESNKDALDFLTGHNATIKNCYIESYDDCIFIGGLGYPSAQVEAMGDVYDMEFININYVDSAKAFPARGCFVYTGSWANWTVDSTYKTGDNCLNAGNIYQCNNANSFSAVAANAPVHESGVIIGADGISWHQIDTGNYYTSNVYDISFDNCYFYENSAFLNFQNTNSDYTRNIYPGTEDSARAYNFSVSNSEISNTIALSVGTNIYDVEFTNCTFDSLNYFIENDVSGLNVDSVYVLSENNTFTNSSDIFFIRANSKKIVLESINDSYENSTFENVENYTGSIRVIDNKTLPFESLTNLTPITGDICTDLTGTYEWDGDSWEEY